MELTSPTYFAKETVQTVQNYVLFSVQTVTNLFQRPFYLTDIVRQADSIGVGSLPIVVLTGFFTGAVLALQASTPLSVSAHFRLWVNWFQLRWFANWAPCLPA